MPSAAPVEQVAQPAAPADGGAAACRAMRKPAQACCLSAMAAEVSRMFQPAAGLIFGQIPSGAFPGKMPSWDRLIVAASAGQ